MIRRCVSKSKGRSKGFIGPHSFGPVSSYFFLRKGSDGMRRGAVW